MTGGVQAAPQPLPPPPPLPPRGGGAPVVCAVAIAADNIGHKLLKLAGWKEGTGLGSQAQVRVGQGFRFSTVVVFFL